MASAQLASHHAAGTTDASQEGPRKSSPEAGLSSRLRFGSRDLRSEECPRACTYKALFKQVLEKEEELSRQRRAEEVARSWQIAAEKQPELERLAGIYRSIYGPLEALDRCEVADPTDDDPIKEPRSLPSDTSGGSVRTTSSKASLRMPQREPFPGDKKKATGSAPIRCAESPRHLNPMPWEPGYIEALMNPERSLEERLLANNSSKNSSSKESELNQVTHHIPGNDRSDDAAGERQLQLSSRCPARASHREVDALPKAQTAAPKPVAKPVPAWMWKAISGDDSEDDDDDELHGCAALTNVCLFSESSAETGASVEVSTSSERHSS
eukprot:gnl/TRDRNA2_/TRDRNA2_123593_c1_seq1.p1 gnl/TRDRNA2_/TRDRNA2_123593_c1~~gnl/TRDRNA2_/TRDRNA2_123593_c1_seq1.p1  ORF type:complete len:360 (+),score=74.49 gnl/TRDRNA2_/TRDRNA2_123593_c1_seq1:105-1082(+)